MMKAKYPVVPAGHTAHTVEPSAGAYRPAGHAAHVLVPAAGAYVPAAHGAQAGPAAAPAAGAGV